MESPSEFAAYLGYSVGWRAVRLMPQRVAYRTFSGIADQLWRQQGSGVAQLQRNLGRVVPDASQRELRELSSSLRLRPWGLPVRQRLLGRAARLPSLEQLQSGLLQPGQH